ncbi:MAG: FtsW/RodA/SpoVE family cell cycle protein, partial [Anaerolinea sp.]|nr:FtsW/RodA/SpoVE family cell cycle protein [Anaerolinea sp.]
MTTIQSERVSQPHRVELLLLAIAGVFLLVNGIGLAVVRGSLVLSDILPLVIWGGCAAAGSAVLNRTVPQRDPFLFPLAMFMSGGGLIAIERLAPPFADRQMVWLIVSTAVFMLVVSLRSALRLLRAYRYTMLFSGLALLAITIIFGVNPSGQAGAPRLWLGWQGFFFQPSELLKIILVAFLSSYLAEQYAALRSMTYSA